MIVGWLFTVVIFFLADATCPNFSVSDSVMIAYLTSTTVSVIGLFVLVAKWLFQTDGRSDPKATKKSGQSISK